jgi:hypothetical protein
MVRDESFRRSGRGECSKKKSVGKEKRRMRIINGEGDLVGYGAGDIRIRLVTYAESLIQ